MSLTLSTFLFPLHDHLAVAIFTPVYKEQNIPGKAAGQLLGPSVQPPAVQPTARGVTLFLGHLKLTSPFQK